MVITSKAAKHSSSKSNLGFPKRDNAITNFFFCPPDRNLAIIFYILSSSNFEIRKLILSNLIFFSSITISLIAFKLSIKLRSLK